MTKRAARVCVCGHTKTEHRGQRPLYSCCGGFHERREISKPVGNYSKTLRRVWTPCKCREFRPVDQKRET